MMSDVTRYDAVQASTSGRTRGQRMGEFQREEHRCERNAERAGKHRAHPHQRPQCLRLRRKVSADARQIRQSPRRSSASGASTPPEVPELSEKAHISDLAITNPKQQTQRVRCRAAARRCCRSLRPDRGERSIRRCQCRCRRLPATTSSECARVRRSARRRLRSPYINRLRPAAANPTRIPSGTAIKSDCSR